MKLNGFLDIPLFCIEERKNMMYTPQNKTYADILAKVEEATEKWITSKKASSLKDDVVITDEDIQAEKERIFIEKYGTALYDYKLDTYRQELDGLKVKAREQVDQFNSFVKELEQDDRYTERGQVDLYRAERKKVEKSLKEIGEAQHKLGIDIQKIEVEAAHRAWEKLEKEMAPNSISPSEYQYIEMLMSRNDSEEMRQKIAKQFHYHISVLDYLNADRKFGEPIIKHPLEDVKNRKVNYIQIGDVRLPETYSSRYLSDLLRNFKGKIFFKGDYEKAEGALF
ncbi:phage protein [Streptococcus dysgalactiae subsp. equisimilis]|nr:phage protein [Streptococcus dysgalactiae subsp. equisimilis]